jgi:hypothetical protein
VVENVFTFRGRPGHEITFVFLARFADATLHDEDEPRWTGSDGTERGRRECRSDGPPLYPSGTYELLRDAAVSRDAPTPSTGG